MDMIESLFLVIIVDWLRGFLSISLRPGLIDTLKKKAEKHTTIFLKKPNLARKAALQIRINAVKMKFN